MGELERYGHRMPTATPTYEEMREFERLGRRIPSMPGSQMCIHGDEAGKCSACFDLIQAHDKQSHPEPKTQIRALDENQGLTQLISTLETPWLGSGIHKPKEMEQAAAVIRDLLRDKGRCTKPCAQLIALYATVERLEDIVFRIQRECAGMEHLIAGLEARR